MNANQKETFYSNFDFFLKNLNLKKSDIEKEAGVSQGYLSRFQKNEDSNNFPSVSFLECCSRKFSVAMDDLINTKFDKMNETEESVYKFLQKLIDDTKSDKKLWKIYSWSRVYKLVEDSQDQYWEGFSIEKEQKDPMQAVDEDSYYLAYPAAEEVIGTSRFNEDLYMSDIYKGIRILLIPISGWNKDQNIQMTEWTLWMEFTERPYPNRLQCIARGNDDVFNTLLPSLLRLKNIIVDRQTHIQVNPETKKILDWFANGEPEESNPFNYEPVVYDPNDLPF